MKKIFKKKLFRVNSKLRIYIYIIAFFLSLVFIAIIYQSHKNRVLINNIKHNPIQVYYKIDDLLYDFLTDSSITKFVNNKTSFNKLAYIPSNLEYISSDYVTDSKGNSRLREEANIALQDMAKDFYDVFGVKMQVVSAYRSYDYQVGIKSRGCSDLLCAKAGFSEHQTGLAVDLWETTTKDEFLSKSNLLKYFNWMKKNAYKYGFHNTYQKGLSIDGYLVEPWHWRYLGFDLASELHNTNKTFAEYYYINK